MMQSSAAKGLQDEVNAILGIPGLLKVVMIYQKSDSR